MNRERACEAGAIQGLGLVVTKGKETFLVQCKQWKAFKVGVDVVRELYGVMAAKAATGGFVVTSGRFTADAQAFADGRNVKLVDGPRLLGLIKQVRESVSFAASGGASRIQNWRPGPRQIWLKALRCLACHQNTEYACALPTAWNV